MRNRKKGFHLPSEKIDIIGLLAERDGVERSEVEKSIYKIWEIMMKSSDSNIKSLALAMMEGSRPPAPEKIYEYLAILTRLQNDLSLDLSVCSGEKLPLSIQEFIRLRKSQKI